MSNTKLPQTGDETTDISPSLPEHPRLFVSYSWSSPEHEDWVIGLSTQLREAGVDVILDKWYLREGHDANAFMEKMVTDPDVKKVIMICDKMYVEKADGRAGGVGTETQIISAKVYEQSDQSKFVAVIREQDDNGKPLRPAYYQSRIYIDMSQPEEYITSLDKLLRWVYDKPLHIKPELGATPAFLSDKPGVSLGTSMLASRAIDALRNGREYAGGAIEEYLEKFAITLEQIRIERGEGEFDDAVVESIESFIPTRDEMNNLISAIAKYHSNADSVKSLQRFFERLIPYLSRPSDIRTWHDNDFDNFRFVIHELFLYTLAIFIHNDRFDTAASLIQSVYYVGDATDYGDDGVVASTVFYKPLPSLQSRNDRLKKRCLSLHAELLKDRCRNTPINFDHLMQADFVMYLYHVLRGGRGHFFRRWWPVTLIYASNRQRPFEIFARSVSASYFNKTKVLIGIKKKEDLAPFFECIDESGLNRYELVPTWEINSIWPPALMGYDHIATLP